MARKLGVRKLREMAADARAKREASRPIVIRIGSWEASAMTVLVESELTGLRRAIKSLGGIMPHEQREIFHILEQQLEACRRAVAEATR